MDVFNYALCGLESLPLLIVFSVHFSIELSFSHWFAISLFTLRTLSLTVADVVNTSPIVCLLALFIVGGVV